MLLLLLFLLSPMSSSVYSFKSLFIEHINCASVFLLFYRFVSFGSSSLYFDSLRVILCDSQINCESVLLFSCFASISSFQFDDVKRATVRRQHIEHWMGFAAIAKYESRCFSSTRRLKSEKKKKINEKSREKIRFYWMNLNEFAVNMNRIRSARAPHTLS